MRRRIRHYLALDARQDQKIPSVRHPFADPGLVSVSMLATDTSARDWLISALLGSATWPGDPSWESQETIEHILASAEQEGVAVTIFHSIRSLPCWHRLPELLQQGLSRAAKQAVAWDIASREILTEALDALSADGIDFLLLKGAGLAYLLYPAPHYRTRGDTDVLVADRETADRAWRILHELGYKRAIGVQGRFVSHQFACTRPGPGSGFTMLDIHWRLSNSNLLGRRLDFTDLWRERRAVDALGPHAATLSARHALIHALFHRAWHLGEGDPDRLIWLYDLHLLCASFGPDAWVSFVDEVNRCGLGPICRDGLQDRSALLGTSVPPRALAKLHVSESTRYFGQLDLKRPGARRRFAELMSLPTWPDRLQLIREHLFPDAAYMQEQFAASSRWKLPLAYLSRAAQGVRKRLRA